jgi:hypothetical protein
MIIMSELLRKAFEKLEKELPESEQDALGKWFLSMLKTDERAWLAQFQASADELEKLADKVLAEYAAGETELLDRKRL